MKKFKLSLEEYEEIARAFNADVHFLNNATLEVDYNDPDNEETIYSLLYEHIIHLYEEGFNPSYFADIGEDITVKYEKELKENEKVLVSEKGIVFAFSE